MPPEPSDPVADYLRAIEAVPPLPADEEMALVITSQQGDETARKKLIEASLRLVVPIARRYEGRGMHLPDLVQEGNLGLIRAVERFDPTEGREFSAFATRCIEESIAGAIT
jgi:DNA-directed RNA polymerase sigma subunit (sigma70/sigma32)